MEQILLLFTVLAILISSLGLFGLATFNAQQRAREIGIRKVLGASSSGLVVLLSNEFSRLVLLANIIAWPLAWYAMDSWLQDFAYRTDIDLSVFFLSAATALAIALATVGYQAYKTANANPIEVLRNSE